MITSMLDYLHKIGVLEREAKGWAGRAEALVELKWRATRANMTEAQAILDEVLGVEPVPEDELPTT